MFAGDARPCSRSGTGAEGVGLPGSPPRPLRSDRPFGLGDPDPVDSVRAVGLPPAERDAIFHANARRLLRLT